MNRRVTTYLQYLHDLDGLAEICLGIQRRQKCLSLKDCVCNVLVKVSLHCDMFVHSQLLTSLKNAFEDREEEKNNAKE